MKFGFSENFRQSDYAALLREVGGLMEWLRVMSGSNVKSMMSDLHVSHPSLKKS